MQIEVLLMCAEHEKKLNKSKATCNSARQYFAMIQGRALYPDHLFFI